MRGNSKQAHLLGVGLDASDGHRRVTRAEEFSVVGGSEETHEKMNETLIKTFEDLRGKGKALVDVEKEELAELLVKNSPVG